MGCTYRMSWLRFPGCFMFPPSRSAMDIRFPSFL
ncbi:hypothetical protein MTR67_011942 [Solanum verrucosum]|uniref:Uncharacterized protein n=1 Tax=Solanum verrucosum TaxID=315347 RepID=A0AAF0Q900_SOLVR|nr:hypothetical protein MTR67_011942 [Solanum verrucosum]